MSDQPVAPLVSEEVDLTDFKFMPLEVQRLLASEWWLVAGAEDPRRAYAAVNLWARAWHQRPAASLPNNDGALARLAMVDRSVWREIRDAVLGPWVLCSDGRWYHPVVAEKANAAWEEKVAYQERKRRWKESGQKGGLKRAQGTPEGSLQATLEATPQPKEEKERVSVRGEGKGKGKGLTDLKEEEHIPTADADGVPAKGPKGEGYTAEFEAWWSLYPSKTDKGAAFRAFVAAKKLVPIDRLMDGVRAYAASTKGKDPQYIKHAATWLTNHCWNDEAQTPQKRKYPPGYVPMGPHGG